jgi:hypothetical protein
MPAVRVTRDAEDGPDANDKKVIARCCRWPDLW